MDIAAVALLYSTTLTLLASFVVNLCMYSLSLSLPPSSHTRTHTVSLTLSLSLLLTFNHSLYHSHSHSMFLFFQHISLHFFSLFFFFVSLFLKGASFAVFSLFCCGLLHRLNRTTVLPTGMRKMHYSIAQIGRTQVMDECGIAVTEVILH